MYRMKKIIVHDDVIIPKCMYHMKNIIHNNYDSNDTNESEIIDLKISAQVMKFLKMSNKDMAELEERQDQLLEKLDILYERIKNISSYCTTKHLCSFDKIPTADEIVISTGSDNLPWYLFFLKKQGIGFNLWWHIHSSVPINKVPKIKGFMKEFTNINNESGVNIRIIFSDVSADTELKLSSLAIPIIGDVNVLRYLSLLYPKVYPSNEDNFLDNLLDMCYLIKTCTEKSRESIGKKIFSQYNEWIYNKEFTIVDVAAYNVIKQWRNCPKFIPTDWFMKCEQLVK